MRNILCIRGLRGWFGAKRLAGFGANDGTDGRGRVKSFSILVGVRPVDERDLGGVGSFGRELRKVQDGFGQSQQNIPREDG